MIKADFDKGHSYLPFGIVSSLFLTAFGLLNYLHGSYSFWLVVFPPVFMLSLVTGIWWYQLFKAPVRLSSKRNLRYGIAMTAFVVFILYFSYLQVPLFHLVCHRFGIHGGVEHQHHASQKLDVTRKIPMHMTGLVMQGLPCYVHIDKKQASWHPGGKYHVGITIGNTSNKELTLHPILSASPERASLSLHFEKGLPDPLVLKPHQVYQQSLPIQFAGDFPNDIPSVFFSVSISDTTNAKNPGTQRLWYEMRTRYPSKKGKL